jgi:hypothetical protein
MLNLIRSASRTTRTNIIGSRILIRPKPSARYASDTGLGGFGALSVPIPLKGQGEISYGKSKLKSGNGNASKDTSANKERRRGRAISAARRSKQREQKAKPSTEVINSIKDKAGEANKELLTTQRDKSATKGTKEASSRPRSRIRGRKADTRGRRAGNVKPLAHHTYGIKSEAEGARNRSADKVGVKGDIEERIQDTDFAPEEIEGMLFLPKSRRRITLIRLRDRETDRRSTCTSSQPDRQGTNTSWSDQDRG